MGRLTRRSRKTYFKQYYEKNKGKILEDAKIKSADDKSEANRRAYKAISRIVCRKLTKKYHGEQIKDVRRLRYATNSALRESRRLRYVEKEKLARRMKYAAFDSKEKSARKLRYASDSQREKSARRVRYASDSQKEKSACKLRYASDSKEKSACKL